MPLSAKSLAGPGYIILNALRAVNVVALLAVVVACVVMLVKIDTGSSFFFFDAVGHVITIIVSAFLTVSELNLFRSYFARNWPSLSPQHGFTLLGLGMVALGVDLLANLDRPELSVQSLGRAFWRVIIGAGILAMIVGVFNIAASFVFRDRSAGITARQVRAKGAVALAAQTRVRKDFYGSTASSATDPELGVKGLSVARAPSEGRAAARFPHLGPKLSVRSGAGTSVGRAASSCYSDGGEGEGAAKGVEGGRVSPFAQYAHLARPDSTYHPSRR